MKSGLILISSIMLQMILGGIYAWSIFVPPLNKNYNISVSQSSLIFGITILVFTISMTFAGKVLARRGPRFTACIGAVLYTLGYLIASVSRGNYFIILSGIGIITGAGIGFGYVCPLTTCIKWFPKNRGLITGLAVAGFGAGAIVLTKFVFLLQSNGTDILMIFRSISIYTGIPAILAATMLSNPLNDEGKEKNKQKIGKMLFNKVIIAMMIGMFSGTFGGLMVVSNIKQIGLANGIAEQYAVMAISLFAVGNALGRIIWGTVFDKAGKKSIPVSLIMLGGSAVLMLSSSPFLFNVGAVMTGITFGGCFVLYFLRVVQSFGDLAGQLYPYVFLAYGVSAIAGPALGGRIYELTDSYRLAIYGLTLITLIGAVIVLRLEGNLLSNSRLLTTPSRN